MYSSGQKKSTLRMLHAHDDLGACEALAPKIDLWLVPDIQPIFSSASSIEIWVKADSFGPENRA